MSNEGTIPPEVLEKWRNANLAIDREGTLLHEGEPITHPGLRAAFYRWLDRLPDGRHVLRLDEQRYVYIDVADTPLVATSARVGDDGRRVWLGLTDGREEPLDPATLTVDDAGVLRCRVHEGRLEARLGNAAAAALADRLMEQSGRFVFTRPPEAPLPVARR